MKSPLLRWLLLLLRLLIAGVFIYAGAIKVAAPVRFASDISNYHLLPWSLGVRLAFYLPWLEIMAGLSLVLLPLRKGATLLLSGLTFVFIVASVTAKARGIDISCGCFGGAGANLSFLQHLMLDVLILAGLIGLYSGGDRRLPRFE